MGDSVNSLHFFASGNLRDSLFSMFSLHKKRVLEITTRLWHSGGGKGQMVSHGYQESKSNSGCCWNLRLTLFGCGSLGIRLLSHENTFFLSPDPVNMKDLAISL